MWWSCLQSASLLLHVYAAVYLPGWVLGQERDSLSTVQSDEVLCSLRSKNVPRGNIQGGRAVVERQVWSGARRQQRPHRREEDAQLPTGASTLKRAGR